MKHSARFAEELRAVLPGTFKVEDLGHDLFVAHHEGGAMMLSHARVADKRRAVRPDEVRDWVRAATARLRQSVPHYTPQARREARLALGDLELNERKA